MVRLLSMLVEETSGREFGRRVRASGAANAGTILAGMSCQTRNHEQALEALLLRMLPPHLRMLNRQRGKLIGAKKHSFDNPKPDPIKRPHIFGRSK